MRVATAMVAMTLVATTNAKLLAQETSPSDYFQITSDGAETWSAGTTQIVSMNRPVVIKTEAATFTADSAVVWFSPVPGSVLSRQRAQVALIGNATVVQGQVTRSGDRLFASTVVGGPIRLTVKDRTVGDPRQSELYKSADEMRPVLVSDDPLSGNEVLERPTERPWVENTVPPSFGPTTPPVPAPKSPVNFSATDVQTTTDTPDGNIAVVLQGGVILLQRRPNGDLIELQAQQAVLFSTIKDFGELQERQGVTAIGDTVTSAYLEGDVRINFTPAPGSAKGQAEQRLSAERVYYEFASDRAVLTDVVLQSKDPRVPLPVTMRAKLVKQLAIGEYKADNVVLTTSQFATPSYSVNASKAYVRQYAGNDTGTRTQFAADNGTFRAGGVPFFYLPRVAGEVTENGIPLRRLQFGGGRNFGIGVQTDWGLFESLGLPKPAGLDATYKVDYYGSRGPGLGFDADYTGGFVTDTNRQGWNFLGDFSMYGVIDHGEDRLGRQRVRVPHDDDFRGRVQWQHQHFFPDNWQLQLRAGYTSDPTFLEEWYERDFDNGLPTNLSAYAKRQSNTEALTFLVEYQPSDFVTTADGLQERFTDGRGTAGGFPPLSDRPFEVDRLPEVAYYRVGDSVGDDSLTFYSENRLGGLAMHDSSATLADYGFQTNVARDRFALPGIPSYGYTGTTDNYVVRGDLRQEIDWPTEVGQFKVVPYLVGRYTGYSDSPVGDTQNRLLAGVGTRITTSIWKIDDSAESRLFDIHRLRHVIEPELHLFASTSTVERDDLYIYDETIDGVNDIAAASFWIRQRWQTKRGGPGSWRNSDVFGLNLGIIAFANEPADRTNPDADFATAAGAGPAFFNRLGPTTAQPFRGLFFQSTPEASVPRTSLAGDGLWRISDTTILLSDFSYNLAEQSLATVSAGLLVGRGDRVNYYTGLRYIGDIDSLIASFTTSYELTQKYSFDLGLAVDLSQNDNRTATASVTRKFDRFAVSVGSFYNAAEDEGGLQFAVYPEGVNGSFGSAQAAGFGGR